MPRWTKRNLAALVLGLVCLCTWHPAHTSAGRPGAPEDANATNYARDLMAAIETIGTTHIAPATRPQMVRWAVEALYRVAKQPVPAAIAERLRGLDKLDRRELACLLRDARASLGPLKKLQQAKDLEVCLQAIFDRTEPVAAPADRSCYMPPQLVTPFGSAESPHPAGVGLVVKTDPATGFLQVVTPVLHSPAYRAGLRGGDLITSIWIDTDASGKPLPRPLIVSTRGLSAERAQELFLGRSGTHVLVTVIPAGSGKLGR
jgi:hypothetical protein